MSPWLALLPLAVVMCAGSWASYDREFKSSPWFPWCLAFLCVVNGLLWAWAVRQTVDSRQVYSLSIAIDVVAIAAYSVLPLVVFNVRLSPTAWVGLAMVMIGAFLVKVGD